MYQLSIEVSTLLHASVILHIIVGCSHGPMKKKLKLQHLIHVQYTIYNENRTHELRYYNQIFYHWGSQTMSMWSPSPLIVSRYSFSLWTWARVQTARRTAYFNGCPYIFLIYYYITIYVCVPYFITFPLWYDPVIIERTIGAVLGPFTAFYRSFLKRCTLTNKAVGTIWRALSKPPQRRQGPDPRPLWLLVGTPSAFWPELAYRLRIAQPILMDVPIYFWYTTI